MKDTRANSLAAVAAVATFLCLLAGVAALDAHGVTGKDAVYLQGLQGRAIIRLMYFGVKDMVTGYHHTAISQNDKKVDASALRVGQSLVVDADGDTEEGSLALEIRIVPPIRRGSE